MKKYIIGLFLVITAGSGFSPLFAFTGEAGTGYFPLFLLSQEQLLQEKQIIQEYESQGVDLPLHSEKDPVVSEVRGQSVPLLLPSYVELQLPLVLPETGVSI